MAYGTCGIDLADDAPTHVQYCPSVCPTVRGVLAYCTLLPAPTTCAVLTSRMVLPDALYSPTEAPAP
eukprot:2573916-Rhodomonas_salina.1